MPSLDIQRDAENLGVNSEFPFVQRHEFNPIRERVIQMTFGHT